jgi:hypothetical protein
MAANQNSGGWAITPIGTASPSTMAPMTPQQVAQIQATTGVMAQPTNPQQSTMMSGLFKNPNDPNGLGANLGSMGMALWGSSPAYGGGNIFTDPYGGSAQNPLPGLTAADYG